MTEFEKIFYYLNLPFNQNVRNNIVESSASEKEHKLKRNSQKNIFAWKGKLTEIEIDKIKNGTKDVARLFYSEGDW